MACVTIEHANNYTVFGIPFALCDYRCEVVAAFTNPTLHRTISQHFFYSPHIQNTMALRYDPHVPQPCRRLYVKIDQGVSVYRLTIPSGSGWLDDQRQILIEIGEHLGRLLEFAGIEAIADHDLAEQFCASQKRQDPLVYGKEIPHTTEGGPFDIERYYVYEIKDALERFGVETVSL